MIPERAQAKVKEGVVLAVGPEARAKSGSFIPMGVSVGDKVILPEGEEFQIFRETYIVAKLD